MAETQITETTTTETTEVSQPEERKSSLWMDILTIIGFAILFIIIIWGLVHLVELVVSSFSGNQPAPTIQVNAPAQTTSGQPATISWNYSSPVAGSYAFLYQCQNGLEFQASASTTSGIPCGVAYTIGSATSSLSLIPELSATSSVSDTISVVFIPTGKGSQVQGDATMTVNPATAVAQTTTKTQPAKTSTTNYAAPTSYAGPAQLAVSIISGSINQYGDGTVTFNIVNVGGATSGSYTFSAQLPTAQPYPYQSPVQTPLAPGAHVVSTLNFTDAASGGGIFSVTVEGGSANSSSDYASMEISGPYNSYNNLPAGQAGYNYSEPDTVYPAYTY